MALDPALKNFKGTVQYVVDKKDPNKYVITEILWDRGVKVGENTYTEDLTPPTPVPPSPTDPYPDITGVYQKLHPTTYATDTSVQDPPVDFTSPSVTVDVNDISNAFVNCVALTSVNFSTDVLLDSLGFEQANYAFAGCKELVSVDIGTKMYSSDNNKLVSMFEGCTKLETIVGTIDLSLSYDIVNLKDMFKGCTNLQSVSIKNGESSRGHCDLTEENVEIDGQTYTHVYEYLGLTDEQFASAVTIVTE